MQSISAYMFAGPLSVGLQLAGMSNVNHLRTTLSFMPFFETGTVDFLCSMIGAEVWCSESFDVFSIYRLMLVLSQQSVQIKPTPIGCSHVLGF